jgi:hypothetical protein
VAAAEQRPQQHELRLAGVLVLVQQDHVVAAPLDQADLGVAGRDPGRQRHLVTVVEHLAGLLLGRVPGRQRQELFAGALALNNFFNVGRHFA